MAQHLTDDDLVEFEVGYDRFRAQAIAAECTNGGLTVEALLMDNAGQSPGLAALQPHRLLARTNEAQEVSAIVRHWFPADAPTPPVGQRPGQTIRLGVALLLLTVIVAAVLSSLIGVF